MSNVLIEPKKKQKNKVKIDFAPQIATESQVIIHCVYHAKEDGEGIRIWPSTFLFARDSTHVSKLVHAEKISMYPVWTWLPAGEFRFTLVFSGLPKGCLAFDLVEDCNGAPGSFMVENIQRTQTDVYQVII